MCVTMAEAQGWHATCGGEGKRMGNAEDRLTQGIVLRIIPVAPG